MEPAIRKVPNVPNTLPKNRLTEGRQPTAGAAAATKTRPSLTSGAHHAFHFADLTQGF